MVADALSRKKNFVLSLKHYVWRFESDGALLAQLRVMPNLKRMMIDAQKDDIKLQERVQLVKKGDRLYYKSRLCVPDVQDLKKKLMYESHNTVYTMHLGGNKMYQDLKQYYWWRGMKKDIVEYVSKCLTCQQVKAKHQVPSGLLNPISITQWKWDNITMDFVSGFPLTQKKHDSVCVIVDRLTKSAHFLPVQLDYSMDRLAKMYMSEIVHLHGITVSRVSDRNPWFTSRFGKNYSQPWVLS